MGSLAGVLKRSLAEPYLAGTASLTRRLLGGRSGPRDFSRVIVVAPLGRRNGIASGAHLQYQALRQAGVDAELLDAAPALRNPLRRIAHRPGSAYIFHAAGPQTANLVAAVLPAAARAWRVGYWAWELPDPPPDWAGCDRTLCEVWTPTRFARDGLARIVDRPLHVVPHHVPPSRPRPRPARAASAQSPFTVLVLADARSSLSRKNPHGALAAFRTAFGGARAAHLVLKLNGGTDGGDPGLRALLDAAAASGGTVSVVDGFLDDTALAALYDRADVLLSLHRAEGFGLPLLEAMGHGIPVVATGWSGNLDFMDAASGALVPCTLVPVRDAGGVYSASIWAEPDIAAASAALRRLAEDPAYYADLAAAAHRQACMRVPLFPFALPRARP